MLPSDINDKYLKMTLGECLGHDARSVRMAALAIKTEANASPRKIDDDIRIVDLMRHHKDVVRTLAYEELFRELQILDGESMSQCK